MKYELIAQVDIVQAGCIVESAFTVQVDQVGLANDSAFRSALTRASGFLGLIQNQLDAFNVLILHCYVQGSQRVAVFVVDIGAVLDEVLEDLLVLAAD